MQRQDHIPADQLIAQNPFCIKLDLHAKDQCPNNGKLWFTETTIEYDLSCQVVSLDNSIATEAGFVDVLCMVGVGTFAVEMTTEFVHIIGCCRAATNKDALHIADSPHNGQSDARDIRLNLTV